MKKILLLIISTILLASCGTTKLIKKPKDIKATEKTNIVFVGYTIFIPDNRISNIEFMCENLLEEKIERCFKIPIKSESGEFVGASPYKVDFGKYRISNMYYQIKVGEWVSTTCSTDSKGKRSCSTNRTPKYEDYVLETNYNKEFEVTETESPYIGGFLLLAETDGNQKPTLKVVETYDKFDKDIAYLNDEDLKLAITNHLTNLKE